MTGLIAACAVFLILHLGVAGTPLRGLIVRGIGEKAYLAGFALCALGLMVWICRAYGAAYAGADNRFLFTPPEGYRDFALPVVGLAFLLGVPGFLLPNPTSAGQGGARWHGAQRITRHPFLWGAALWAAFHLGGSGDVASTCLFLSFLILALAGTRSIDAKCRRRIGDASWQRLAAESSNLPFAAIFQGRNTLVLREIFDGRFAVSVTVLLVFLALHTWLFGLSPFPGAWQPDWLPPF